MVLYPLRSGETAPPITRLSGNGAIGARVERGGISDTILFSPAKTGINLDDIASDGESCAISSSSRGVEQFALQNGSHLQLGGRYVFSSSERSSSAFRYSENLLSGKIAATTSIRAGISSDNPESVHINGVPTEYAYDSGRGLLSMEVQAGESRIDVVLKKDPG
jgi:hypothetical protein